MGKKTAIAWTDHTFNPWIGCTKVSPGCFICYAETQDHRWGHDSWGPGKPRRPTSEDYWKGPIAWNEEAKAQGVQHRVFCASMADVFDAEAPAGLLDRLIALVEATPHLEWLLLTKRTQRMADYFATRPVPQNAWLGTSVEDQKRADERIPILLGIEGAKVRFLSCEPQLEPLDLTDYLNPKGMEERRIIRPHSNPPTYMAYNAVDWVICGGESGHGARRFDPAWAESLHAQVARSDAAWFFKQVGAIAAAEMGLKDKKGESLAELRMHYEAKTGSAPAWATQEWPDPPKPMVMP